MFMVAMASVTGVWTRDLLSARVGSDHNQPLVARPRCSKTGNSAVMGNDYGTEHALVPSSLNAVLDRARAQELLAPPGQRQRSMACRRQGHAK